MNVADFHNLEEYSAAFIGISSHHRRQLYPNLELQSVHTVRALLPAHSSDLSEVGMGFFVLRFRGPT